MGHLSCWNPTRIAPEPAVPHLSLAVMRLCSDRAALRSPGSRPSLTRAETLGCDTGPLHGDKSTRGSWSLRPLDRHGVAAGGFASSLERLEAIWGSSRLRIDVPVLSPSVHMKEKQYIESLCINTWPQRDLSWVQLLLPCPAHHCQAPAPLASHGFGQEGAPTGDERVGYRDGAFSPRSFLSLVLPSHQLSSKIPARIPLAPEIPLSSISPKGGDGKNPW